MPVVFWFLLQCFVNGFRMVAFFLNYLLGIYQLLVGTLVKTGKVAGSNPGSASIKNVAVFLEQLPKSRCVF